MIAPTGYTTAPPRERAICPSCAPEFVPESWTVLTDEAICWSCGQHLNADEERLIAGNFEPGDQIGCLEMRGLNGRILAAVETKGRLGERGYMIRTKGGGRDVIPAVEAYAHGIEGAIEAARERRDEVPA